MLNDIIKTYSSSTNNIWETPQTKANAIKDGGIKSALDKSSRVDTIEISNKANDFSSKVASAKSAVVSELSGMHTDVNKFLQIKDLVRNGSYELNPTEIAKSITGYAIF